VQVSTPWWGMGSGVSLKNLNCCAMHGGDACSQRRSNIGGILLVGHCPLRRPVTVAIGMLGCDGAVLAADTRVTAGNIKGTNTKLIGVTSKEPFPPKALGLAGTGHLGYFDAVKLNSPWLLSGDCIRVIQTAS
jgi:hypothetical protein